MGLADDNPSKEEKVFEPVQVRVMNIVALPSPLLTPPNQVIFPPPPEDDEDTPDLGPYRDADDYKNRGTHIVAIAAGTHNNLAVAKDGSLYAWGQGSEWMLQVNRFLRPTLTLSSYPALYRLIPARVGSVRHGDRNPHLG